MVWWVFFICLSSVWLGDFYMLPCLCSPPLRRTIYIYQLVIARLTLSSLFLLSLSAYWRSSLFCFFFVPRSCFALSAVSSAVAAAALSCWRFTFAAAARVDLGDGIGEEERTACSRRGKVAVFVCVLSLRSSSLAPVGFVLSFAFCSPPLSFFLLFCVLVAPPRRARLPRAL